MAIASYKNIHFCFICLKYFFSVGLSVELNTIKITEVNDIFCFHQARQFYSFKMFMPGNKYMICQQVI